MDFVRSDSVCEDAYASENGLRYCVEERRLQGMMDFIRWYPACRFMHISFLVLYVASESHGKRLWNGSFHCLRHLYRTSLPDLLSLGSTSDPTKKGSLLDPHRKYPTDSHQHIQRHSFPRLELTLYFPPSTTAKRISQPSGHGPICSQGDRTPTNGRSRRFRGSDLKTV